MVMDRRLGLLEARRYAAAVWRPCAVFAATIAVTPVLLRNLAAHGWGADTGAPSPLAATALVGVVSAAWIAKNLRRAAVQPRRDHEAAQRLAELATAAGQPHCRLLEITHTQWVTAAGQRAWAVDSATGSVGDHWFPASTLPPGAFVLLRRSPNEPPEVLSWLPPNTIRAAGRHAAREARRRQLLGAKQQRLRARHEKEAARDVIHEAEQIARGH
jgi:hypothetical protein